MPDETAKPKPWIAGRLLTAAIVIGLLVFVAWGTDGLVYPYRIVRISFRIANVWAEAEDGAWFMRVFQLLELLSLAWFALLASVAWMVLDDANEDGTWNGVWGAALLLGVGLAPLAVFVWKFAAPLPSASELGRYFAGA